MSKTYETGKFLLPKTVSTKSFARFFCKVQMTMLILLNSIDYASKFKLIIFSFIQDFPSYLYLLIIIVFRSMFEEFLPMFKELLCYDIFMKY